MNNTQFVLAALRCTALRVSLIRAELDAIGVALGGGLITPEVAVEWCHEIAPGCLTLPTMQAEEVAA